MLSPYRRRVSVTGGGAVYFLPSQNSEFIITVTELNAIAAPASIGLRKP